jgi:hypothetical protein
MHRKETAVSSYNVGHNVIIIGQEHAMYQNVLSCTGS